MTAAIVAAEYAANSSRFVLDNNLKDPVPLNFESVGYKYIWNIIERGGKWYEFSVS